MIFLRRLLSVVLVASVGGSLSAKTIDVNALVASGEATVTHSTIDIGSIRNVFDGDTASLARSAAVNPMTVRIVFDAYWKIGETGTFFSHASEYRWKVEAASNVADLESRTGTYRLLTDWRTAGDQAWSRATIAPAAKVKVVELTAERLVGDDYVHLNEWELVLSTRPFEFIGVQRDPINGRVGVTWRSQADVKYEVLGSVDMDAWTPLAVVDANGSLTSWYDPGTFSTPARFYRVGLWEEPTQDLDVGWIGRTPRYDYDAPKGWPDPGDPVTFHAHVLNLGNQVVGSVGYRWTIDGTTEAEGVLTDLLPEENRVVGLPWVWQAGNHTVGFEIDPAGQIPEISEENNEVVDRINGLAVGFWVEQSVYDYFREHQIELGLGSNSWEDWAQRQIRRWNEMLENARWPLTPDGVLDRVRLDKVTVVPDGALPLSWGLPTNHPDTRDKTVDMMWGFPATLLDGDFYAVRLNGPFNYEGSLIHELNHARYLIDSYGFDVHGSQVRIEEDGTPVAGTSYMPYIAWEVVHYNDSGGMMSGDYTWYSEYDAACWNRIAGRRAKGGNYNAPSSIGEWLNTDLPETNVVTIVDHLGNPIPGADVKIYQSTGASGWYAKDYDNIPDYEFVTDADGTIRLPRNPFGTTIVHGYGNANGVLIFRIEVDGETYYRFHEVTKHHKEYWRGHTDVGRYTIQVDY